MNSIIPKIREKMKNDVIKFFVFKIIKKQEIKPKNNAKKEGIRITVNGIKNLKFWSNVKEIDIQYKLVRKNPKPNNQPYKKNKFKFLFWFDFLTKNKKNKGNEIKFIKKKIKGVKLKDVAIPNTIKNINSV